MAKFSYNNTKNANTSFILFKLNCKYNPQVLFKENVDSYLRSRSTNKQAEELK